MSQALVTFDEVAVYFSEEEWRTLEEWQKELYKDVMRENYRMVLSLSRPDIISSIELGNDPVVKSSNGKRSLLGNLHQAGHCLKQHEADQELQRGENHQETTGCKVDVMGAYLQRSCEANLGKSAKQPRRYPRVNPIRWVKREKHVKRKGCQKSSAEYMGKAENVPEKPAGGRDASTTGESVICSNDANPGGDHEGAKQDGVGDHPTDVGEFEMDTMIEAHKVDIRPPEKPSTPVTEAQRPGEHNGKSQEKCDTVMCKKSENAIQETSVHRRAVSAAENSEFEELKQGDKARLSEENNVRVANLQDKGELHNDSNKSHGNVHHLVIEDNRAHEVDSTVTKAQHEYDLIGSNDEEDLGTTQILPKFASETQETSSFDSEKISTETTQTHCPRPLTNYHSPIPQILEKDEEEKTTPCKKSKKQRKDRHVTFNETVTMFIIEAREDKFAYNEGLALRSRRLVYTRNLSEEPGVQSIYNERGGKLAIEASVDELNKEIEENTEPVKVTSNPTENWENNMKSGNMSHVSSKSNQKGHRTAIDQLNDERRNMKRTVTYLTADHRRKMQRMVMYNAGEESKKIQRIVTYPTVEERTVMYPSVDQNRKIQRTVMYLSGEESREMESLVTYPSGKESRKMDRTVMYPIGKESRKMQRMVTYPTGEGSRKTQRTVTYPTDDESRKMQRNVIDPTGEKSKKVQMTGTDPNDNESRKMQRTVTDPTDEESRKMQRTVTDPTGEESRRMQRTVTALTHEESRKLQRTVTEPTGEESREMQMTVTDPTDEESRGMQMTVTDPTDEESRGMQMTVTDPTDEESRGMQMTVTDPTDNESREMQMTVTDPTDEESREMQMTVTDPTNEESRKMQMTVTDPTGEESKKMQMTVTDTTDNESRKMQRTVTDPTGEESKKMQMTVTDPTDNESMKTQRTVTDPTEESRKMQRTVADPSNEESRKMQATVTDPTEESRKIQMSVTDPTGKETRKMQTTVTDSTGDESRKTQKNLTDPTDEEIGKTQSTVMDLTGEKSRRKQSTVAGRKDEKRQKKQRTVTAYPTGEESRKKKRTNDITSSAITEGTSQNTSPLQDEEAWNANKNSTKHDPTFMNKKESTHLNEKCVMQGTRNEERSQVDADSVQNNSELIKSYSCVNCSKITHWSKLNDLQKSNIGKMPYLCSKCSRMSKIMENASTPVSIKKKRTGKKSSNNRNDSSDPTIEKNKRLKGKKNELHKREESIAGGEGTFPKEINKEEVESADDGADTVATHLRSSREDGLALSLHNNEKMLGLPSIQDVILENTSYSYSKREATGGHHNPNARNNPCKKPKQTDECPNSSPKILQKPGFSSSGSDKEEYEHCVKCGKCKVSVHDKVTWNKKPQMCLRCSKPVQETCTGKIRKCNHYHRAANENFKDTLPSETRDRERNAEETSGGKVEPEKPVTKSGKRCEDCGREANPHTHNQSNLGGNGGWSPKKQSILVKHKRKTREGTEKNCETIRKQRRPSLAKGGPYGCNICGKTFTRKFTALKHRTVHTGEKPFLCQECGKRFRDRGNLQSHMRSHTKEKPYECLECGKCFSQTSSLIVHHRTHTNERPFECTKCGKSFSDRSTFINHKLIHTGLKPFECKYCGKKFTQKSQVVRHEKIHTGEKPHGCSVCGRRFLDRAKLTKHEAIHAKTDARKTLKWE